RDIALEIRLLGEPTILIADRSLPLPASKQARAIFAYLVANPSRAHTRDRLCAAILDGSPDPRATLRWCLSKLRSILGDRLVADRQRVSFEAQGASIDVARIGAIVGGDP